MESPVLAAPPAEVPGGRQGCARNALIGCGVAAIVLLAVVVGFFLFLRRNPTLLMDLMMKQVESRYGPDVTEQDKADLRSAYQEFRAAITSRRVDRAAASRLQVTLSANRSNQFDRERVRELARAFREAAAPSPRSPELTPSPPAPASTP